MSAFCYPYLMEFSLTQLITAELRGRDNESVKGMLWDRDSGSLWIFAEGHTVESPRQFNLRPATNQTIEEITDSIVEKCNQLQHEKR